METSLYVALGLIFVLATLDLWVGVANDAVNFLNSAIGSRITPRSTIVAVAALGVFFGALSSSGLMEVARRGVFDPSAFYDPQTGALVVGSILAIYLAVMVTDVLLLDLFNTFGLPTSTTVSIISELVGASLAVALWTLPGGLPAALDVIRAESVLGIYTGIFTSVIIAFTTACALMVIVRLIYGHDVTRSFPRWGWLWTGVSMAAMAYFVVFKGLSNAAILPDAWDRLLHDQILAVVAGAFSLGAGTATVMSARPRVVLGGLILLGTFALAVAFAGNDLVNFIGPSVAAAQAVFVNGVELSGRVPTPPWALALAGGVMVAALLRSQKAKRVTDTEIRLAGHGSTTQRFEGNATARGVLRVSQFGLGLMGTLVPGSWRAAATRRLTPPPARPSDPPYDPLRASVNLTVAALLISTGTTLGLPLSTTYITFTAAMGAALGDFAWRGHDAEQRVAGILIVLGGWVVTGLLAASSAFVVASILVLGGPLGIVSVALIMALGLYRMRSRETEAPEHG